MTSRRSDSRTRDSEFEERVIAINRVAQACRKGGLLMRPLGNVIALVPPLSTSSQELTKMVAILHSAIVDVTEGSASPA